MKIFMDTANVAEIAEMAALGVVYGVTTNPSLIAKSGRTQAEVIPEICSRVDGPVSAEVISTDCEGMVAEARTQADENFRQGCCKNSVHCRRLKSR